jgi:fatty-acyl-CoA synthase
LAGFKKPKKVIFVDELPKTVSGKIIKKDLRERFANS